MSETRPARVIVEGAPWFLVVSETTYVESETGYLNEGDADLLCEKIEEINALAVFLFTNRESAEMLRKSKPKYAKYVPARPRDPAFLLGMLESGQALGVTEVIIDFMGLTPDEQFKHGSISEVIAGVKKCFPNKNDKFPTP